MLKFYFRRFRKSLPLLGYYFRQFFHLIGRGKIKAAFSYMWTILVTKEDGAGLLNPLFLMNEKFVPYPERIELEPTTKCNFKCLKCESAYWDIPQRDMTFDEFKHIVDQFPTLKAISISGIGHNWLNKDYMRMLEYLKSKNIFTQFFDTFYFINEERAKRLIEIKVDKIWMSIDGATKETYENLQVGSDFNRVIQNLKNMLRLRYQLHSNFPEICFHYIVTQQNFQEMPRFIELVHSINPDPKMINLVQFTKLIPFKENKFLAPKVSDDVIDETLSLAAKFGNFRIDTFRMGEEEKKQICECLDWTVPFITVDGTVYPCCAYTEGNMRQIMHKYGMGNVLEEDFKQIWYSDKFRNFRKTIHENKVPPECKIRNCPAYKVD